MLNYRNFGRLWKVYGRSLVRYSTPKKVLNALRTEYAYRKRQVDVRSAPYILMLEPLYYCNLECPLCDRQVFPHVRTTKKTAGHLPLETVDKLLDEVGDYLYQCQIFGQGEPLINWPLTRQIIQRFHDRKVFTLLSSNMTLVTPEIAEDVATSGLDHWVAAIDGVSQEAYEIYRKGKISNVETCFEGLRYLVEARKRHRSRMTIEWQYLVHRGNVHELEQARKIAADLGIFFRPSPLRGMEFDPELQSYWLPEEPSWRAGDVPYGGRAADFPCYFLWRAVTLNSNTKLARCLIYQNVSEFGSVRDHTLMEVYNSPSQQRARMLFSKGNVPAETDFPSPCRNCAFFARHHGGANLDKFGSLGLASARAEDYVYATHAPEFIPLPVTP